MFVRRAQAPLPSRPATLPCAHGALLTETSRSRLPGNYCREIPFHKLDAMMPGEGDVQSWLFNLDRLDSAIDPAGCRRCAWRAGERAVLQRSCELGASSRGQLLPGENAVAGFEAGLEPDRGPAGGHQAEPSPGQDVARAAIATLEPQAGPAVAALRRLPMVARGSDLLLVRTSNRMIFDVLADAFQ